MTRDGRRGTAKRRVKLPTKIHQATSCTWSHGVDPWTRNPQRKRKLQMVLLQRRDEKMENALDVIDRATQAQDKLGSDVLGCRSDRSIRLIPSLGSK